MTNDCFFLYNHFDFLFVFDLIMHFADEADITVESGSGGNGSVSMHREKYIAKGGPDGGNGGNGGSVIFQVNENLNTLVNFLSKKHYKAKKGEQGHGNNKFGKKGEDLIVQVPAGTMVYDETKEELLADLNQKDQSILLLEGGLGGKGNANFATSIRQTPDFAELGEPGKKLNLHLELKLIAEVAIIGYPSVGKSTLISRISNARPKIADYPFTTLVPNLGVVKVDQTDFVVADIPGLIEGAHEGKGLGDAFLKHIERAGILLHVIDMTREDFANDYKKIRHELECYSHVLSKKPEIIAFSKIDSTIPEMMEEAKKELGAVLGKETPFLFFSAVTGENLDQLLYELKDLVLAQRKKSLSIQTAEDSSDQKEHKVFRPHLHISEAKQFEVEKLEDGFRVSGKRIEQLAIMTDMTKKGGIFRMHDIMKKIGAYREMKKRGGEMGDKIYIGPERVFEFMDMD